MRSTNRKIRLARIASSVLAAVAVLAAAPAARADGGNLLLKNGTVITVTRGIIPRGDVLIMGGTIKQIGENIPAPAGVRTIDVSGKYILPGVIDSHTHIALAGTNEGSEPITPEVDELPRSIRLLLPVPRTSTRTKLTTDPASHSPQPPARDLGVVELWISLKSGSQ